MPAVATLELEAEPAEVGLDADRLARIEARMARYVDDGHLPGFQVAITRRGKLAHVANHGHRDVEAALAVEDDTVFRIFSMTKAITSVAVMMLHEEGAFELKDPIHRWIPSFRDTRRYVGGNAANPETVPTTRPVRIWQLLTHTAGLTYGFMHAHAVDEAYRTGGYEWAVPPGTDLEAACDFWASQPLLFEPGTEWNYSVATDVLGRLVEVASGQSLDQFFRERIFEPLGMVDTGFGLPEDKRDRLAALYIPDPGNDRRAVRFDPLGRVSTDTPEFLSGGGGLVSTTADYLRFLELLRRGGELDGHRLLGPRTVAYMTRNHLPGHADLEEIGRPLFAEATYDGTGFGLGFAVVDDPVKAKVPGAAGQYSWGGAASTAFWVDPTEEITAVFMTQLLPSSTWPIRSQLGALVNQAILD